MQFLMRLSSISPIAIIVVILSMLTLITSKTYPRQTYSTLQDLTNFQPIANFRSQEYFDRSGIRTVKKSEAVYEPTSTKWQHQPEISRQEEFNGELPVINEIEDDNELVDYFLEVMGPGLFMVPFVLMVLPLLLPAIPLALLLPRSPGEGDAKKNQSVAENLVNLDKLKLSE